MRAADLLLRLEEYGYAVTLADGRLKVRGTAAPRPELERAIVENRDALKAAVLLSDPPPWLVRLLDLCRRGHETRVRLTSPASGKTERYPVRVSPENIAAAVAIIIGMPPTDIADEAGLSSRVRGKVLPWIAEAVDKYLKKGGSA